MQRYVEKGIEEVGATNLISNIILVYRGFDTFGESCVLVLAATCVMILLRKDEKNTTAYDLAERAEDAEIESEENTTVLRSVVRLLMPVILLFGVYVLLNGHLSPGGGFSGGAILGAGLILFENAFGLGKGAPLHERACIPHHQGGRAVLLRFHHDLCLLYRRPTTCTASSAPVSRA